MTTNNWQQLPQETKKMALVLIGAIVLVFGWGWWWFWGRWQPYDTTQLSGYLATMPDRSQVKIQLGKHQFLVEVVNSPASISRGLSGRSEIGADGMLFVLPAKTHHSFWMPQMKFDLDLLWFDEGTLLEITPNVPAPPPGTATASLPLYTSHKPANMVLEIPAGQAELLELKPEDQIKLL